ncbi:vascular endothelial growth factor C isoform X1 [Lates japonicus]
MHLLGISLLLAYLLYTNLASDFSHSDYHDYYEQEQTDESDSQPKPDMEQKLRSASSVDELMSLIYPSYWAALKCRSKLSAAAASSASKLSQRPQPRRLRPLADTEEPTFAAAYLNLDILKSIESEWRKTQCMPREVCVDVGREFGAPTNIFYKPPCVSVYRCGGCCHSEDKQCRNISTGYLSKTLFEITVPITQGTRPVTISVANHTQCTCLSKLDVYKQVHSIIRRALPECPTANRTCPPGQTWSNRLCWCVSMAANIHHNTAPPPLPPPQGPPNSTLTYFQQMCVAQTRNWMWKRVSVCVSAGIKPKTVALTDISTAIPVSVFATFCLRPPARSTTSSTRTPASAHVSRHVRGTSPSIKQSVPVNVMSHPISVS